MLMTRGSARGTRSQGMSWGTLRSMWTGWAKYSHMEPSQWTPRQWRVSQQLVFPWEQG